MRDHEVPTHVQAEDRVLLWFTFPQVVAMTAVCALSYGAYRYAPVGPSEVRMALAVVMSLAGVVAVVGKIGGRRLPLVAADLLRFWLGARRYAGPPAQLVRSEPARPPGQRTGQAGDPPAPAQSGPGPLRLMARRAKRGLRRRPKENRKKRKEGERRNGRRPLRPHGWLGKRRRREENDNTKQETRHRKSWLAVLAVAALAAAVVAVPQVALADGHWQDEIEFQPPEPVPGRRIFVEGLQVSGDSARVTLRAATDLDLRVRVYGGPQGRWLRFFGTARLHEGERTVYSVPLSGESPSLTFSWEDELGQAGAVTFKDEQIPYPLPSAERELCGLGVASLGWSPGSVEGTVASECVAEIEEAVSLQTAAGHHSETVTALLDAEITAITGTVTVVVGGSRTSVSFVPNGETRFQIPVPRGEAVHGVAIEAELRAELRIPVPPLARLTHHPERTEYRTETVRLVRPGTTETVSETVSVTNDDGTTTEHTVTAHLSIPSKVVYRDVTLAIVHPERVEAEVVAREPVTGSRGETLALALSVGADDPFEVLTLPEPEPEPVPAGQTPLTDRETRDLFGLFGWRWPW